MIENLNSKIVSSFLNIAKSDTGGWRLVPYLVLMLWSSWFDLHWSLFFTTNNNKEIYSVSKNVFYIFKKFPKRVSISWICYNSDYSFLGS